jgi:AraC family transcriptional regulator
MSSQSRSTNAEGVEAPLSSPATIRSEPAGLTVSLRSDPAGVMRVPALPTTYVSIHIGAPVMVACKRGGVRHRGKAVHGDIDIIPAQTPSVWELARSDTALLLGLSSGLLTGVVEQLDFDPRRVEIRNQYQIRDPQLENIGWALKSELDAGFPSGRLYLDSLALSVGSRLVSCHSSVSQGQSRQNGKISGRKLKDVVSYIEDNLSEDISLSDIAGVAGLSVSHLKRLFRESTGLPVHQYVIRRRVEYAKILLSAGRLPISQVALEAGFAHQSHLAYHMRRMLGASPKVFRNLQKQ